MPYRNIAEKYRTAVFLYKPRPTGSVCSKKTSVQYFSVKTLRSVNKKLCGIYGSINYCGYNGGNDEKCISNDGFVAIDSTCS
jgi:hypothetical protein